MRDAILLAASYLAYHRGRTLVLVFCVALACYLPVGLQLLVSRFRAELTARGKSTPLVVGAKGSRFDLALHALYFDVPVPEPIPYRQLEQVTRDGLGQALPLLIRHRARGFPIVGTSLEYLRFRECRVARGRNLTRLGDCVVGAEVARQLQLEPGDGLLSDPDNVFDIAGSYPLKMRVSGVLAPTRSADDHAVFVDLRTAWVIEGLGHGHQDVAEVDESVLLKKGPDEVVASAGLMQYTEITAANLGSFHFHGDRGEFPLTAVVVVPRSTKAATRLAGRFQSSTATAQLVEPADVVDELIQMVMRAKRFFDLLTAFVGVMTLLLLALVVSLSLKLRHRELATLFKLGCSRFTIFRMQAAEILLVLAGSGVLVAALVAMTLQFVPRLVFLMH